MSRGVPGRGVPDRKESRVAYHAGTWMPALIFGSVFITYLYAATGELTWERPFVYGVGVISLGFGVYTLVVDLALAGRRGERVRFYPLALAWCGFAVGLLLVGILAAALEGLYGIYLIPEALKFGLIVGGTASLAMLSAISYAGSKRDILADPSEPVPGKSILEIFRKRRRK